MAIQIADASGRRAKGEYTYVDKHWSARWIMDEAFFGLKPIDLYRKELEAYNGPKHRDDLKNRHMLARKTFVLKEPFDRAILDITADDTYKLYINGQFVGQGPAQGNYYHYYYNRHDVTSLLREGDNVIAVHVYYQGLVCRAFNSGDYRQGLIAELSVDGRIAARTDSSWKIERAREYEDGGIIGYDTQYLEHIDNRLKLTGWRKAEFDDTAWLQPFVHEADDHRLFEQPTPPLSVYTVKPARIAPIAGGEGYSIDFGEERTGQFTMKAQGSPGQTVEIRCGEE
ncbi:MAG: alpha-L-rhamnosidase, partial [Paenibacillus sp.]|nr:alpha-L-rhamnosidase [Paenibacillus sp.]